MRKIRLLFLGVALFTTQSFAYTHYHFGQHRHAHSHQHHAKHHVTKHKQHQDYFLRFLEGVRAEAKTKGISQATLNLTLSDTEKLRQEVLHPKKLKPTKLTFDQYSGLNLQTQRVLIGQKELKDNWALLQKISKQYQVPPQIIVALWGMETNYGRIQGSYQEIPTLLALSYHNRRHRMFERELYSALEMLDKKDIDLKEMHASWAGAMGQCQFMPSTYLNYAVDYDGDGKKNIWHDKADIFASTANFIHQLGWDNSHGYVVPITVPSYFDPIWAARHYNHPVSYWLKLGVKPKAGYQLKSSNELASIYYPTVARGQAYLVYRDNFKVIYGWNHSSFYALTVGLLAHDLAKSIPHMQDQDGLDFFLNQPGQA